MSGLGLFLSDDAEALVERYVALLEPTTDPLVRSTVVVPNAAVGQWFEQSVARRTGRDGREDGVVANVDVIFAQGLVGRVLYGDARALDSWSAFALALALMDDAADAPLSWTDALARGGALEQLIVHRSERLEEALAAPPFARERRLVARRAAAGDPWPAARFARDGLRHADLVGSRVALVGCLATMGGLLPDVARALAETARVDVLLAVADRTLTDAPPDAGRGEPSLVERWGAPTRAFVEQWRTRARPDAESWVESGGPGAIRGSPGAAGALVEVHRTVGVARQVEVARDALLRALVETGASPHQVRVVSPDAARVAPLLSLYFQCDDAADPASPRLQFEVADPHVARGSARLDGLRALLRAASGDLTVYDVAQLLGQPSLRAGLGLSRRDAERLVDLAREGRVSLGLDAASRAPLDVFDADDDTGTWSRFVERVVLASVFDVERDDVAPDVATLGVADDLAAVARFGRLTGWLAEALRDVRRPRELGEWADLAARWSELLARDERARDPGVERVLTRMRELAGGSRATLSFSDARELIEGLADRVGGATLSGRGGVTFLDLDAASALPFEVTCVIGLDDEVLPEPGRRVDDTGEVRLTDPDPRREFRQALLNLLSSTRRRLLVVTNDRRVTDGGDLPTTLPLAELVDELGPAGRVVELRHARHGFSMTAGDGTDAAPSFDPVHAAVARALAGRDLARVEADVALRRLRGEASPPATTVEAGRLADYFRHPQRVFLRDALGAVAGRAGRAEEIPDVPYLDLGDHLAVWSLREGLLRRAIDTGEAPRVAAGPDSPLAAVASGFRDDAVAGLRVEELDHLAGFVRRTLGEVDAVRDARGLRPTVVRGRHREVARPPVELFSSAAGPLVLRVTSSTSYASRVVALMIDLAVVTVELGGAVTGVLLRGRTPDEVERDGDARPFLTASWASSDPLDAAQRLLGGLLRIYDRRFEGLPLHFHATSLALGAPHVDNGLADLVGDAAAEWFSAGYGLREDRGESLEPENRLLVPLDFDELLELDDGAVGAASIELARVLSAVSVRAHSGATPWTTVVRSMAERP